MGAGNGAIERHESVEQSDDHTQLLNDALSDSTGAIYASRFESVLDSGSDADVTGYMQAFVDFAMYYQSGDIQNLTTANNADGIITVEYHLNGEDYTFRLQKNGEKGLEFVEIGTGEQLKTLQQDVEQTTDLQHDAGSHVKSVAESFVTTQPPKEKLSLGNSSEWPPVINEYLDILRQNDMLPHFDVEMMMTRLTDQNTIASWIWNGGELNARGLRLLAYYDNMNSDQKDVFARFFPQSAVTDPDNIEHYWPWGVIPIAKFPPAIRTSLERLKRFTNIDEQRIASMPAEGWTILNYIANEDNASDLLQRNATYFLEHVDPPSDSTKLIDKLMLSLFSNELYSKDMLREHSHGLLSTFIHYYSFPKAYSSLYKHPYQSETEKSREAPIKYMYAILTDVLSELVPNVDVPSIERETALYRPSNTWVIQGVTTGEDGMKTTQYVIGDYDGLEGIAKSQGYNNVSRSYSDNFIQPGGVIDIANAIPLNQNMPNDFVLVPVTYE